ncbi:MAG TPA: DNA cytosine methyltransferase [Solirubrobacterales bacterium]|nr:DNA cytosine methyltransferase [Solirubrobacterales bacterium]
MSTGPKLTRPNGQLNLKVADQSRQATDLAFLRRNKAPAIATAPDIEIVDLFSGCGGLTIGAIEGVGRAGRKAGLALAVDNDETPLKVLIDSLGVPDRCVGSTDLSEVLGAVGSASTQQERSLFAGIGKGSLLLAGPPCQGHSALNNHTRHDDPRNDLYLAVGRAARILQPVAAIVENVRSVGSDRRSSVSRCTSVLEELGYEVTAKKIDLATIGVPQRRIRHVLVATKGKPFKWDLPITEPRDVRWAIGDLAGTTGSTVFDSASNPNDENRARMEWLLKNDEYDLPNKLRPVCHQSDHSYRSMYGRLRWDRPAQTITSGFGSMGQGRFVHPARARTLTPHEAARLQFLPDYMNFTSVKRRGALAQMIGNAAPPLLATVLVEMLIEQSLI